MPPPSEHMNTGHASFLYALSVGALIMFLIGFFGLPLLARWFGAA